MKKKQQEVPEINIEYSDSEDPAQQEYEFLLGGILKRALQHRNNFTVVGRIESLNHVRLERIGYVITTRERTKDKQVVETTTKISW